MRFLLLFGLLAVGLRASAQSQTLDSLQRSLATSTGIQRVDLLNALGYVKLSYDHVEAWKYVNEAFNIANELNYTRGKAQSSLYQGIIEANVGHDSLARADYRRALVLAGADRPMRGRVLTFIGVQLNDVGVMDSAKWYYEQSYQLLKDSTDPLSLSFLLLRLSDFYKNMSDPTRQLALGLRSWEIRKKLRDKHPQVWAGVNLAGYYVDRGEYKRALDFVDESLKALGRDTINNEEMAALNKYRAIVLANQGSHIAALNLFVKAKQFYERNPFPWDLVNLEIQIGFVQAQVANYETALKYYFQALKLAEDNHFRQQVAQLHFRIARVYYLLEQDGPAEDFAMKSLSYCAKQHLELDEAFASNLLGSINIRKKKFDVALAYFNRALELRQKNDFRTGVAGTLGNLGEMYDKMNDLSKAEDYQLRAMEIAEKIDYALGRCYSYQSLGNLYLKKKELGKARLFLDRAENYARKIRYFDVLAHVYKSKSDLWRLMGDDKNALRYLDRYEVLKDSLLNKNVGNRILSLQYDFEVDKKDNEIKILNQQRQLQQSRLLIQQTEIRQQRYIIAVGLIIFLNVCIGFYIGYRFYARVKKLNREISEQNEEITTQSEELKEGNELLSRLNREISEQKEEIQAQAEELTESNETISRVNLGLEVKVKARTAELKEAYNELDTFFYRSSHDFRRPLTTFMGLAEVAKITVKDTAALELFEKVNDTARNLDKMLLKLQSVSAAGSQDLIYSEVRLEQIFQIELDNFREEVLHRAIHVTVDVKLERPFVSYPVLVKFIVQNLVENSIAFANAQSPYVKLKAYQNDVETILEVNDNGQGIEQAYVNQVFDMYFRANERSKGNGLGLYIVKKMADKLNGRVELTTEYGVGTTVRVYFPNQTA